MATAFVSSSQASITVYTDRTAWESAVGSFSLQDFEAFEGSQTEGAGTDVGDFTVRQLGTDFGGIFSEISSLVGTVHDLNDGAAVGGATDEGGTGINFSFDTAITSFGADIGGWSDDNRASAVIAGSSFELAEGQTFFGFIDNTGTHSSIDFAWVSGLSDGGAVDNVSYRGGAVPEPAAFFVWSVLGSVVALGRRKRHA